MHVHAPVPAEDNESHKNPMMLCSHQIDFIDYLFYAQFQFNFVLQRRRK